MTSQNKLSEIQEALLDTIATMRKNNKGTSWPSIKHIQLGLNVFYEQYKKTQYHQVYHYLRKLEKLGYVIIDSREHPLTVKLKEE